MQRTARENYLTTQVTTASPQKLRLMLIDGAIRSTEQTRQLWQEKQDDDACESLIRAQQIVAELLGGLERETLPELAERMAAIYVFVYRTLSQASLSHDEKKLDEVIDILKIERETWQKICEQFSGSQPPAPSRDAARQPNVPAPVASLAEVDAPATARLSIEA